MKAIAVIVEAKWDGIKAVRNPETRVRKEKDLSKRGARKRIEWQRKVIKISAKRAGENENKQKSRY